MFPFSMGKGNKWPKRRRNLGPSALLGMTTFIRTRTIGAAASERIIYHGETATAG